MGGGGARIPIVGESSGSGTARGSIGLEGTGHAESAFEAFKKSVLERQIDHMVNVKKRTYFADLPKEELEKIEEGGRHRMRRAAALDCRALLAAARAERVEKAASNTGAAQTSAIGVQSAYRSISEDTMAWNDTFLQYYNEMVASGTYAGEEHGSAARRHMFGLMKDYKAPPGYSNHSNGMAVDFNTTQAKKTYAAKKKQNEAWKKTWFHRWLELNAHRFGFKALATEAWHWDYDPSVKPPAGG